METKNQQTPPQVTTKKKKIKWWWIALAAFFVYLIIFTAIGEKRADEIAQSEEEIVEELTPQYTKEDLAEINERISILSKNFNVKTDEFEGVSWVKPNSAPDTHRKNWVYMYFMTKNGKPSNLRLVIQYYASDWLFIKNVKFLINEQTYDFNLKFDRDNSGGMIWEWADVSANNDAFNLLLSLNNDIKMRLEGKTYHDDRTLSKKEVDAIHQTIDYYTTLKEFYEISESL